MSKIVKFIIENVTTKIEGVIPPEVLIECGVLHSFYIQKRRNEMKNGKLTFRYYPAQKERTIQMFNKSDNSFPTGWIKRVKDVYRQQGYTVLTEDIRTGEKNKYDFEATLPFPLRYYQEEAVAVALRRTRTILKIGTGGGKTLIAVDIADKLKTDTLIIVPSLILLDQTYDEFCQAFGAEHVGRIGEGDYEPSKITVASIQTLWARRDNQLVNTFLRSINCLIIDECHFVGSKAKKKKGENYKDWELGNTWFIMCQKMMNAKYRIGLTATPGDENTLPRRLLEATIGRVGYDKGASELIDEGFLTPVHIKMITCEIEDSISNYKKAYKANIIENKDRNQLIVDTAKELIAEGKTVLIIVNQVERHGKVLETMMEGEDVEFLWGQTKKDERKDILDRFKSGDLSCLITTVVKEGANIPVADALIYAQAGKSKRTIIQRVGRVMRLSEGKESAIIIDFYDEDGAVLEKHSNQRLEVYRSEEAFKIEVI